MTPILITSYPHPDLDGLAGAFGYAEFLTKTGQQAEVGMLGKVNDESQYILDTFNIPSVKIIQDTEQYNKIILVDTSNLNKNFDPNKVIEIIDHRKDNEAEKFSNAKIYIELVGAAATLVVEKFIEHNIFISKESAILLAGAIISNTLNFKSNTTTDRDIKAFEWLKSQIKIPENFAKDLFNSKSDLAGPKLEQVIRDDFISFTVNKTKVGIAQIEIFNMDNLIKDREEEIIKILNQLKIELGLNFVFLNLIDLEQGKNICIPSGIETQNLLDKVLKPSTLMMRKEIVPPIKEYLQK